MILHVLPLVGLFGAYKAGKYQIKNVHENGEGWSAVAF